MITNSRQGDCSSANQRGVALLTALLVVALATIVTVAMARERALSVQRSSNLLRGEQTWQYALGLEAWARAILHEDLVTGGRVDSRNEAWAGRLPLIPVSGGQLSGNLEELSGRFNINTLLGPNAQLQHRRFRRLLAVLGLDPRLADRVTDWIDTNQDADTAGAEDYAYTGLEPGYRTANQAFTHPSELRLILGLDQAAWQRLAPHVSALPTRNAAINVNTATVPVLMSLHETITEKMAETLALAGRAGFTSVDEFVESPVLRDAQMQTAGLAVTSNYFLAHGVVELDSTVRHFYSLIERSPKMRVLRRTRGVR